MHVVAPRPVTHRIRMPGETPDIATGTVALPGSKDLAGGLQNRVLRYSRLGGLRYMVYGHNGLLKDWNL